MAVLILLALAAERATFDVAGDPRFGDPRPAIARYLSAPWRARTSGPQHFCAVGYEEAGSRHVRIHWREGRRILLWEGRGPAGYPDDSLRHGRRDLSLDRDIVASEAELNGSTYRETRAWADGVIADCRARGRRYAISAGRAPGGRSP